MGLLEFGLAFRWRKMLKDASSFWFSFWGGIFSLFEMNKGCSVDCDLTHHESNLTKDL